MSFLGDKLYRWPINGGAPELVQPTGGRGLALNSTRVFMTTFDSYIFEIPK